MKKHPANLFIIEHIQKEAVKSPDPNTKVGACIVNKRGKIIGSGFNDFIISNDKNIFS